MENKKSKWSYAWQYGAIMGMIQVVISVLFYVLAPTDPETLQPKGNWIQSLLSLVVIAFVILWTTKTYRDEALEGYISYGKSVSFAIALALPFLLISIVYMFVFLQFIEPDFMNKVMALQADKMAEKGMSDEQIENSMHYATMFSGPLISTVFAGIGSFLQVLIISLVTSIFTKKDPIQSEL